MRTNENDQPYCYNDQGHKIYCDGKLLNVI